jgi:hypothetical protein
VQCSAANASCGIGFVVASPRVQVQCAATGCSFTPGQSNLTCSDTSCSCAGDASCANSSEWLPGAAIWGVSRCWLLLAACLPSHAPCTSFPCCWTHVVVTLAFA